MGTALPVRFSRGSSSCLAAMAMPAGSPDASRVNVTRPVLTAAPSMASGAAKAERLSQPSRIGSMNSMNSMNIFDCWRFVYGCVIGVYPTRIPDWLSRQTRRRKLDSRAMADRSARRPRSHRLASNIFQRHLPIRYRGVRPHRPGDLIKLSTMLQNLVGL